MGPVATCTPNWEVWSAADTTLFVAIWHQKHIRVKLNYGLLMKMKNGQRVSSDNTATCELLTLSFAWGESRFRGLAHVLDRSSHVPGVAHPWPSYSADSARDLFKSSNGSAVFCMHSKKIFGWGLWIFCE